MENLETISSRISSILDSLPCADDTLSVLEELRIAVSNVPPDVLKEIVPNVSMNVIFGCISQSDSEQIRLCCEILTKLLDSFHATTLLEEFEAELIQGLLLGTNDVKIMCLNQVLRIARECPDELVNHTDILLKSMSCLGHDDVTLASISRKISQAMDSCAGWPELALSGVIQEEMMLLLEQGSVVRYRVYEVVVDMAVTSRDALLRCSASGILQRLLNELKTDDVLSQLNCLELLSTLASADHGLSYLLEQGVVTELEKMMESADDNPLITFILPGLMKFFGFLARRDPHQTCKRHVTFLRTVFDGVRSGDVTIRPVAVETLAFIAQSAGGKVVLDTHDSGRSMKMALSSLGAVLQDSPTELRARTLDSVSQLVDVDLSQQDEQTLEIAERWFRQVHAKPTEFILKLCVQPFPELRWSALRVLQALARQPWGRIELHNQAGFNEYLIDRNTEKDKIGKELKFEVVRTLLEAGDVVDIFGNPYVLKLKVFLKEGPFFVQAQAEVAMDRQS